MAQRLGQNAFSRIHQNERRVAMRGARDHVTGIVLMARTVGNDKLAFRRGEIAPGNVYGNALLALDEQSVEQERIVRLVARETVALALGQHALPRVLGHQIQVFQHAADRSEEHTSELQSHHDLVCRLLLEKKKKKK